MPFPDPIHQFPSSSPLSSLPTLDLTDAEDIPTAHAERLQSSYRCFSSLQYHHKRLYNAFVTGCTGGTNILSFSKDRAVRTDFKEIIRNVTA